ncbi:MAG TPA: FHA domain-containing protein [Candidatus Thermoplasmatota archaeon]|nr:FHA domain-containing protein [Candidatus Thermoplasmatota archaeon]
MDPASHDRLATLARHLETLASPTRLALLHALREPCPLSDIRVSPSLSREGERAGRSLSRQAITHHLEQLVEAGLVRRVSDAERARDVFVLSHERLFAVVDEMRDLARLRPFVPWSAPEETLGRAGPAPPPLPAPPRLVVAYGPPEGGAFALHGPVGARWRLGRARACEARLDHDPYVSAENAAVERRADGFVVVDLWSRNGTLLDGERLPAGEPARLHPGGLLTVGRSVLVFQA